MSHIEYIELITTIGDSTAVHGMNFFAILAAYLVTAFFVGEKLSKFQLWSVSILYSVFLVFPGNSAVNNLFLTSKIVEEFREIHPERAENYYPADMGDIKYFAMGLAIVMVGGWLMSVVFMMKSRARGAT